MKINQTSILATTLVAVLASSTMVASNANAAEPATLTKPVLVKIINDAVMRNIEGVSRENGLGAKILKGGTGVSIKDIKKHGIWGGRNSIFRKPFG